MKIILFANTDWYLYNFRRELALALQARGDEVVLVSPPGEYVERLRRLGFRWIELPLSRQGMNPLTELGAILRLNKVYRVERPDVTHHFTIKCVLYGSWAAHMSGVKGIVNSITGMGYVFLPGGFLKKLLRSFVKNWYRIVMKGTQVIFENNDDQKVFLDNKFIRPEQGHLIPGVGINIHRFLPAPEPEGLPVVLMASRLLWDKGVGEFVQAAKILRTEGLAARFALSGRIDEGNPASLSQEQVEAWRDSGDIEWWGWSDDMPSIFARSSIFCLPSYYREGLPTVSMEAAACALPVVTTDWPGCREAVRDGVSGLLVAPRDVPVLCAALRRLISDRPLRLKMGRAGRVLAEETFASDRIVERYFEVYKVASKGGLRG